MLPLEGMDQRRHPALGDDQIARLGFLDLDIRVRGVEVIVVWRHVARLQRAVEETRFGRAPLMGGNNVLEPGEVLHDIAESIVGAAARI